MQAYRDHLECFREDGLLARALYTSCRYTHGGSHVGTWLRSGISGLRLVFPRTQNTLQYNTHVLYVFYIGLRISVVYSQPHRTIKRRKPSLATIGRLPKSLAPRARRNIYCRPTSPAFQIRPSCPYRAFLYRRAAVREHDPTRRRLVTLCLAPALDLSTSRSRSRARRKERH
jgi:hypothetical protein